MSEDELRKAVERMEKTAIDNGINEVTVKFAGGEPTLAIDSMEYAYDRLYRKLTDHGVNIEFAVLSNGTAITKRVIDFLHRPNVGIGISVDGIDHYHDTHRVFKNSGRGSWSSIVHNIGY
jgi:uncharacterized protein